MVGGPDAGPGHGYRGRRLGTLPYERMPEVVAAADVGVAPYDTRRLPQLRLGFYWSPLKIFECLAAGVPVIASRQGDIPLLITPGVNGFLYEPGDLRAALHHVLHLQHIDGILQHGETVQVRVHNYIGHVAMHKEFTRIERHDVIRRHAAVCAADP